MASFTVGIHNNLATSNAFFLKFVTSSLTLSALETLESFGAGFVFSPSLLYLMNKIHFFGYKVLYFGPFKVLRGRSDDPYDPPPPLAYPPAKRVLSVIS